MGDPFPRTLLRGALISKFSAAGGGGVGASEGLGGLTLRLRLQCPPRPSMTRGIRDLAHPLCVHVCLPSTYIKNGCQNVRGSSCPWVELSGCRVVRGRVVPGRVVLGSGCPGVELSGVGLSVGRVVRGSSCPRVELSAGRVVLEPLAE